MLSPNTVIFLVALTTLAGVHLLSLQLFLYWYYVWLDLPVHFLGGIVVALGMFAFRDLHVPLARYVAPYFARVTIVVVLVMITWEVFEVWAGIPIMANYRFDTALDMLTGFAGGLLGYYVGLKMSSLK